MKKLNEKRSRALRWFAGAILVIITAMVYFIAPEAGLGVTTAFALTVGAFTLEGKDEAIFLGMKEANDKILDKLSKEYISETKAGELILANVNQALKDAGIDKLTEFKDLQDKYNACNDALTKQGLTITELKAKVTDQGVKSIKLQLKEILEANPEKLQDCINKKAPFKFELKDSPITMLTTTVTGVAGIISREVDSNFAHPALPASLMLTYANVASTDSAQVIYVDFTDIQNATLGGITEGNQKTQISTVPVVSSSSYRELGAYIKVSERMINDIPFMIGELTRLLTDYLVSNVETALLTTTSWGLIASSGGLAPAYTDDSLDDTISSPGVLDAIIAAIVQIAKANFYPTLIALNPTDWGAMLMKKTSTFEYVVDGLNYVVAIGAGGVSINGIPVVMSNRITAGYLLVGDFTKANVRLYGGTNVEMGWDGSDFTYNLRTVKAWSNTHLYVKTNEKPAFMYDAIATITAALSNGS